MLLTLSVVLAGAVFSPTVMSMFMLGASGVSGAGRRERCISPNGFGDFW